MKDRILAAWSVLRGTHKAVPQGANWFYANATTSAATSVTTPFIIFDHTGGKS